jgi:hypothetical protein
MKGRGRECSGVWCGGQREMVTPACGGREAAQQSGGRTVSHQGATDPGVCDQHPGRHPL